MRVRVIAPHSISKNAYSVRAPPLPFAISKLGERKEAPMDKEFRVRVNRENIKVSKEVYDAYMRLAWKEWKQRQVCAKREQSLDTLIAFNLEPFDPDQRVDEIVEEAMLLDTLLDALSRLSSDDRAFAQAVFFDGKTERAVADALHVSRATVNKRKHRLIETLRNFILENE